MSQDVRSGGRQSTGVSRHAVVWAGGEVTLCSPQAVMWMDAMAQDRLEQMRRNGVRSAIGEEIAACLAEGAARAAGSAIGSAEVPSRVGVSSSTIIDPIDTAEAARIMHCTDRNVRTRCDNGSLAAKKVGRSWQIERASVLAETEGGTTNGTS